MTRSVGDPGSSLNAAVAGELRAANARQPRLTLDDLAKATGISRSTLFRYLNGKRDIPLSALDIICRALGVDPVRIMRDALEPPPPREDGG